MPASLAISRPSCVCVRECSAPVYIYVYRCLFGPRCPPQRYTEGPRYIPLARAASDRVSNIALDARRPPPLPKLLAQARPSDPTSIYLPSYLEGLIWYTLYRSTEQKRKLKSNLELSLIYTTAHFTATLQVRRVRAGRNPTPTPLTLVAELGTCARLAFRLLAGRAL